MSLGFILKDCNFIPNEFELLRAYSMTSPAKRACPYGPGGGHTLTARARQQSNIDPITAEQLQT
jgi:hypothetical protein